MVQQCVASLVLCMPSALAQPPAVAQQGAALLSSLLLAMLMHAKQSAVPSQSIVLSCLVLRAPSAGLQQAMSCSHFM